MVTLPKIYWPRVLGSVVIQFYADECTFRSGIILIFILKLVVSLNARVCVCSEVHAYCF